MNFWKTSGYAYEQIVVLTSKKVLLLLNSFSRFDFIEWLSWNDPNGIYDDEMSLKEFRNIMSREEGFEIMLR